MILWLVACRESSNCQFPILAQISSRRLIAQFSWFRQKWVKSTTNFEESQFIFSLIRAICLTTENTEELFDRIVELINHAFFEWNDGVIRDCDMFWTYLCATFGDIAVPDAI